MALFKLEESSVFGLNRAINAETTCTKYMWLLSVLIMLAALTYSVSQAVGRFSTQISVFQTDYAPDVDMQFPDVSLCLSHLDMSSAFENTMGRILNITPINGWWYPWIETKEYIQPLLNISNGREIISYWSNNSGFIQYSETIIWDSKRAQSIYHRMFHDWTIVKIKSSVPIVRVKILELIPVRNNFLCLTFQVFVKKKLHMFDTLSIITDTSHKWDFEYTIAPTNTMFKEGTNFSVLSGQRRTVFFFYENKVSLNTQRSPCLPTAATIPLYGYNYNYTRKTCSLHKEIQRVSNQCNCTAIADDIFKQIQYPCSPSCVYKIQPFPDRDVLSTCLELCNKVKMVINGDTTDQCYIKSTTLDGRPFYRAEFTLVLSESMQILREEVFMSVTRLLSEIGGLFSFFIGFSFTVLFEILEACILALCQYGELRFQSNGPMD